VLFKKQTLYIATALSAS